METSMFNKEQMIDIFKTTKNATILDCNENVIRFSYRDSNRDMIYSEVLQLSISYNVDVNTKNYELSVTPKKF